MSTPFAYRHYGYHENREFFDSTNFMILLGIISLPIIVFLSYSFVVGFFVQGILLAIMEFVLIFFTICYNKFFINKNDKKSKDMVIEKKGEITRL